MMHIYSKLSIIHACIILSAVSYAQDEPSQTPTPPRTHLAELREHIMGAWSCCIQLKHTPIEPYVPVILLGHAAYIYWNCVRLLPTSMPVHAEDIIDTLSIFRLVQEQFNVTTLPDALNLHSCILEFMQKGYILFERYAVELGIIATPYD